MSIYFNKPEKRNTFCINPINAELNTICHLLAFLGAHLILHVSRTRVNVVHHICPCICML